MGLQVIQDSKGKNTGVFIPYNEWAQLKKKHKDLAALEESELSSEKSDIANNIKKGLKEVQQYKLGKLKTTSAKDFLNEL